MSARTDMPSGLVTFLFTDIEGSTRLAQLLGAGYRPVLHEHRQVLRRIFCAEGGVELFAEGDSFFFAFPDAAAALRACLTAQRELAAHPWPQAHAQPKVRMGLHSGWASPQGGEYASPEVHRAARIAAAAHGGQVLCSAATAEHAGPLDADLWLRDLGLYRLRGFDGRERLFQLVAPGLPQGFPRPRTELAAPHNLPASISSFVGRQDERAELGQLLDRHRLVTVAGAGGAGKTRLAVAVAADRLDRYPDGVWFVDLAAVTDPGLLAVTVAGTLGLRPEPGRPMLRTLTEYAGTRRMLLLLDTCDTQVTAAAEVAAALLTAGSGTTILATSREPLGLGGELVWRIPPLSLAPAPDGTPGDAVRLLAERTAAARGGGELGTGELPHLHRIATRLGGLPLAIELVAGRLRVLGAAQLAERVEADLTRGSGLLAAIDATPVVRRQVLSPDRPPGGRDRPPAWHAAGPADSGGEPTDPRDRPSATRELVPARHATLRAALEWSYRPLAPEHARLLRLLAVFAGPVDLSTAEWLSGGDPVAALTALVDKSLLQTVPASTVAGEAAGGSWAGPAAGEPPSGFRYQLLDPVRAFAAGELIAAGEERAARQRHVSWLLAALRRAGLGPDGQPVPLNLDRFDPYADEVRTALHWCVNGGSAGAGLQLACDLDQWWRERGLAREGRLWLFRLYGRLAEAGETVDERLLAEAYCAHALQAAADGEYAESMRYAAQAESAARRLGDAGQLARVLAVRCCSLVGLAQPARAERACREVVDWAARRGVTEDALFAVYCLAYLLWGRGELTEAADVLGAARPVEQARLDVRGLRTVDALLGMVALARGDLVAAHDHLTVALRARMSYGYHTRALDSLAAMAVRCGLGGDPVTATELFGAVHTHRARLRMPPTGYAGYWNTHEARLRAALGDARFDAAFGRGAAWSLPEAVSAALAVRQEILAELPAGGPATGVVAS